MCLLLAHICFCMSNLSDQALLTMAINPGYGFVRTQKIEVPLENDRPLFDAARVARVEEAARVATEASIRTKREAKERSAKKRQEVKQMPLRQLCNSPSATAFPIRNIE
jgi:hypothetical protein